MGELELLPGVESVAQLEGAGYYRVELCEDGAAAGVLNWLVAAGVTSVRTSRPTLEEVYVHIIGQSRAITSAS